MFLEHKTIKLMCVKDNSRLYEVSTSRAKLKFNLSRNFLGDV
jgi:hypothetical protein